MASCPSGLIRIDNSVKPSYLTLQKLVKEEWMTDVTLTTDENGCVALDGYRGTYEASCGGNTVSFVLGKNTKDIAVTI